MNTTWKGFLMTADDYDCPILRNKIHKLKNDVVELNCPEERRQIESSSGLPDNIQGNVTSYKPSLDYKNSQDLHSTLATRCFKFSLPEFLDTLRECLACPELLALALMLMSLIRVEIASLHEDPLLTCMTLELADRSIFSSDRTVLLLEEIDDSYYDLEGEILLLEEFLNDDPSSPPLPPQELKVDLPPHLEYAFLEGTDKLPVIIAKDLKDEEKAALIKVLKSHKRALVWQLFDIKGINPKFYTHKILIEDDFKPMVQHQRRVNPKIHEVIKKDVLKLLDAGLIYPISDSPWVSPVYCVPKKGGFTVVENEENELIPTRLVTFKFPSTLKIKKRPHSRVLMERLPTVACLSAYVMHRARSKDKMLKRCEETNFCLNWEKSHFMVKEGIVLGHKISTNGIEVDKAKVDVIAKLPHPTTVKGIRSFLG
ncbi:hypothetical protein Tco_0377506 [Tanacetum coccineum]